jgi:hypothetical protein
MEEGKGIDRDGLIVRASPDKLRKRRQNLRLSPNQEQEPAEIISVLTHVERAQEIVKPKKLNIFDDFGVRPIKICSKLGNAVVLDSKIFFLYTFRERKAL